MSEEIVRTGVDDLLDLLKDSKDKIPLTEVAAKLKVSVEVIQAWVDFLVEEGILGIEYRFTTPFVYMNKGMQDDKVEQIKDEDVNLQHFRRLFWEKAKNNNIPEQQITMLWKNHVLQELELKRKYFFYEAQRRKIQKPEILWDEYKEIMLYS